MTSPNTTDSTTNALITDDPLVLAEQVRHSAADSVSTGLQLLKENELPQIDDALLACERGLRQDRYTVLVCGEAKRGKSTFINALLGKSVLPTDVDIATSQVFQISSAEEETYAVRYEDESAIYIDAEDVSFHGSQVVQDEMGKDGFSVPSLTVRQIEITLPAKFLPSNITLLDTPGLGSLYAGHAKITYRFVPLADAVVFVLDSNAPITKPELTFLGEILDVTPHVFFLQTRIDQVRQADWEKVLARNTAIIRERFGMVLGDNLSIWPVSSQMLLKAGQSGNKSLIEFSRFQPMLAALRRFLFQATGVYRTRRALDQLTALHRETRPILAERVDVFTQRPKGERAQAFQAQQERAAKFSEEWGPTSRGRREVEDRLRDLLEGHRTTFLNAIQPKGSVELELQARVDRLTETNEAEALAHALASQATERVNMRWRQATRQSVQETAGLLAPICGWVQCDTVLLQNLLASEFFMNPSDHEIVTVKDNVVTRLQATWKESGILMGAGAAVAAFMPVVGLPVAAVAAGFGYFTSGEKIAEQAKRELNQFLQKVLSDIRIYYMESDLTSTKTNRAHQFFRELERACRSAMEDEYERRLGEQKREIDRLQAMASISSDEASVKWTEALEALKKWDLWGDEIALYMQKIDYLAQVPLPVPAIVLPPVNTTDSMQARLSNGRTPVLDSSPIVEQFRRSVVSALVSGSLSPQEQLFLRRESIRLEISPATADALLKEELQKRMISRQGTGISTTVELKVMDPEAARNFRRALVEAVRQVGPDSPIMSEEKTKLDGLAVLAKLSSQEAHDMETEIRAELSAAKSMQEPLPPPPPPQDVYAERFSLALVAGGGTISDDDQDELDALADRLSLTRGQTRAIEKELRQKSAAVPAESAPALD